MKNYFVPLPPPDKPFLPEPNEPKQKKSIMKTTASTTSTGTGDGIIDINKPEFNQTEKSGTMQFLEALNDWRKIYDKNYKIHTRKNFFD